MVSSESDNDQLPDYAGQIAAFHRAFEGELRTVVNSLPLGPEMRVLDVGCGDGFYTGLLAERLVAPGSVVGLDVNLAYLELARRQTAARQARCAVEFVAGDLSGLPLESGFDFIWCAQSLYSLPAPETALRQMVATLRPGGLIAVLENDSLHQLLLPWPSDLEIALRAAEYMAFARQSPHPGKYYVGRLLPAVLAAAGLEPLGFRTQSIDRQSPLSPDLEQFLQLYLERLAERVSPHLDASLVQEFQDLIDPQHEQYLLRRPYFTMSWLNVLAWGRKPVAAR